MTRNHHLPELVVMISLGCGPGGGTDTGTGTTGGPAGTAETSASSGATGSGTGTAGVECWQHLDAAACSAAGCAGMVEALRVDDLAACSTSSWGSVCVAERSPDAGDPLQRTFFRELDGTTVFAVMPTCVEALGWGLLPGDDWTECTGAAGDPAGCACFCEAGTCPGQWQLDDMEQCTVPRPCDVLVANSGGTPDYVATAHCVLQALQTSAPARLEVDADWGDPYEHHWVYLAGDGTARRTATHGDHACADCCEAFDPNLDACTLQAASYFADCEATLDLDPNAACAYDVPSWFTECAPAEPSCP